MYVQCLVFRSVLLLLNSHHWPATVVGAAPSQPASNQRATEWLRQCNSSTATGDAAHTAATAAQGATQVSNIL